MRLPNKFLSRTAASLLAATSCAFSAGAFAAEAEVFIEQGQRSLPAETITEMRKNAAPRDADPKLGTRGPAKDRASVASVNQDFWIFDADTRLLFDNDRDGYFTRLELDFNADTVFGSADVYAIVYVSRDGGPWEELTTTTIFSIFGADASDEYFVDADLLSGYPSGSYDVLIELYDTFDGAFVAEFGPADSNELFDLPMEDQLIDSVVIGGPVVGIRQGGGGSTSLAFLALLLLTAGIAQHRRSVSLSTVSQR